MVTLQNRMHARMREVSFFPLECLNSGEDFFFSPQKEINEKDG